MDPPQIMALRADIPRADQVSTSLITPRSTQATMSAPLKTSLIQDADGFTILGGQFTSAAGDVTVHNHYPHPELGLASISTNIVDETFSESEIYYSQLLRQKRGFPLYDPQPRHSLPQEYQKSGVAIGDVGRITPEGAFDFFFNVYLPADHPIHNRNVPEDFSPLPLYDTLDLYDQSYFAGDHVSTPSVQRLDPDIFPGGDFLLSCVPRQGAVLALPHGSHLQKLDNLQNLRKYAAAHAESWFKYINGPRGRGLDGSLYLVTGCEKASSWGLASFHTVENAFQLSFKPTVGAGGYRWRGNPARKKYHDPSPMHDLNQTMFIHGLSISLGTGIWARIFETVQIREISGKGSQNGSEGGSSTSSSQGSSLFSPVLGFFGGGAATDRNNAGSRSHVVLSDLPPISQICHPGQLLNNYILEKHPQAAVVMSHDDDWGEILGDDDPVSHIRTVPEFLQRIDAQYEVVEKDGATFLQAMPGDELATWSKIALPELGLQQSSDLPSDSYRHHNRIIPPEEDMQRLFQECKIGVENANLLAEALATATPEQLNDSVIVELHKKCVDSQELICTLLPSASASAEYSREQAEEKKRERVRTRKSSSNTLNSMNPDGHRSVLDLSLSTPLLTREELFADLLTSNERLLEAIQLFDDLKCVVGEREVEDRSQRDVRMVPRVRPIKWKLSLGKSSASALGRVSPVEKASPDMPVPPTMMSATASNVTSSIMDLDSALPLSASADEWPRSPYARLPVPAGGFAPAMRRDRETYSSSRSPHPSSGHWDADHRAASPNSMRSGRPITSSASSMISGVSGSSVSTTSSSGRSTSAFTRYSNASARSVSTKGTSVSATSWRTPGSKPQPPSALSLNIPKNIQTMNGAPWELGQLPRGQYPDPVGDIFGSPPVRQPRTRKPKALQLGTISERLQASQESPNFQRRDAASSTTDLSVPGSPREEDDDGPNKVPKAQINALAKMLSVLRR